MPLPVLLREGEDRTALRRVMADGIAQVCEEAEAMGLRVVLAVTLAPRFGIQFVWMAVPVGWLVNYLISFFEYRTGRWRRAK